MTIEIRKSQKEGYKDLLKVSRLHPGEYVVISKEQYDEPLIGQSKFGDYYQYNIKVHEGVTLDDNADKVNITLPDDEVAFFAPKTLHEDLKDLPTGVKVKVTAKKVEGKKGEFTKYTAERLDNVAESASSSNPAPEMTMDDQIKQMKDSGLPVDTVVQVVGKMFDTTEDFIKQRYEAL